jgi:hypothetical protein
VAAGIGPSSERRCHPFIAVVILRRQQVDRRSFRSLAVAALIAIFLIHSLYLSCIAEDAFISFRFAKNLAAGHGSRGISAKLPSRGTPTFCGLSCPPLPHWRDSMYCGLLKWLAFSRACSR